MKFNLVNQVSLKGLALLALCLGTHVSGVLAAQMNQSKLRDIYSLDTKTVEFEGVEWKRKEETSGQKTVELHPTGDSKYKGPFFQEIKEISKTPDNKYAVRSLLRPTTGFAFTLGSALIATCVYCWYAFRG